MSKNLTRKGLALGAVVALGSSLFAGAPAFAAPTISVAPDSGTGYTVLASDTFTLKVFSNTEFTFATGTALQWKVTKPAATASVAFTGSGSSYTSLAASTTTVSYLDPQGDTVTTAGGNTLTLNPAISSTGTSEDYIVQAYIESGDAAGLSAGDLVSSPVTVKFVLGSALTSVVTLNPVAAGQAVTGTVKYSAADFNYAQSNLANTKVLVNSNGGTFSAAQSVTLNDDKNGFEYSTTVEAVSASEIIGVKSEVIGYDSDAVKTNSATVYSSATAASTALGAEASLTTGDNIAVTSASASSLLEKNYIVRTGTKSFSYRVDFFKEAGLINGVAAGQPVKITIDELSTSLVTNDVIRVNGKKLTGGDGAQTSPVLNTVTDATGGVTVNVESDLGLVGDAITITVQALTASGTYQAQNDFTWTDAALTSFTAVESQLGKSTHAPDQLSVVRGSSVTLKYAIRDQFGKPWTLAGSNYRVKAVAGGTRTLVLDTTAAFSNGLATLTFTDNSTTANATTTVVADLQTQSSPTGDFTSSTVVAGDVTTNLNIVSAAQAAATLNMDASVNGGSTFSSATGTVSSTLVPLADAALAALDLRSNTNGSATGNTAANAAKISGTVLNSNGSAAAGVPVVIASAGRWFSTDATGSTYVSKDSITVHTNVDGTYEVWALSQRGGAAAITITSGSVSKTQNLKWAAAEATSGKTIAITAPDTSVAGRSVDVVVLLTDKHGAPVQTTTTGNERLSVAITGPGSNTAVAATTDADGKISFKLIFGSNDNGTASVKVTYDADGDATVYAPVVATKTILVGTAAVGSTTAAIAGSTKRMFVSVSGNSTAKNVVVKVAGKTVATLKGSAAKKTYTIRATKGSKKVTVYVGGKLIATKTVTVK